MTVNTKYDIGDAVWIIHNNHPILVMVRDITITGNAPVISYKFIVKKSTSIRDKDIIEYRYEKDVFLGLNDIVDKYKVV